MNVSGLEFDNIMTDRSLCITLVCSPTMMNYVDVLIIYRIDHSSLEKTTACKSDETTLPHMSCVSKETEYVLLGMVAYMGS